MNEHPVDMHAYPWQADLAETLHGLRSHLPHALLLYGPKGLGKRALAKAFIQTLLCERKGGMACGVCAACHWMGAGNHPDFLAVESEQTTNESDENVSDSRSQTGISIAQVRDACDFLHIGAHRAGLRIVMINPAEGMNLPAANALLKTLEEPPPGALLVLLSHQPAKLPATIRSRCQALRLPLPDTAVARQWLQAQGVVDADLCLNLAGGAPLLALEMADSRLLENRRELLADLSQPGDAAVAMAARYARWDNAAYLRWLVYLQQWVHDLLNVQLTGGISYHTDYAEVLKGLSLRTSTHRLMQFQQKLLGARRAVGHPLNLQLVLEDILIDYHHLF
ncbi:MAG: DNA polymerase III subunit delta' [Betaproteobacteria bacterium]|nr:DNA polymerase III subunit delta' [Betaproteobacteria bacterium]